MRGPSVGPVCQTRFVGPVFLCVIACVLLGVVLITGEVGLGVLKFGDLRFVSVFGVGGDGDDVV